MWKKYKLTAQVSSDVALKRVEEMLYDEGVTFRVTGQQITSTRTPIALLGIQPQLYTRRNWVGINPFVFVTCIAAKFVPLDTGGTLVDFRINRRRSIWFALFWTVVAALAAKGMPDPEGLILFATVAPLSWLANVWFFADHLARREIERALRSPGSSFRK